MGTEGPHLRLVIDNTRPQNALMPILDLERRLESVRRALRRELPAADRAAFEEMRELLQCELEARPFNPRLARRCEQRLRWVERRLPVGVAPGQVGLIDRARRALAAILPATMARV